MRIYFEVEGETVGKQRPRVVRRGNHVGSYTPRKTADYEETIRLAFKAANYGEAPVFPRSESLTMELAIFCGIPKSYSKKRTQRCLLGEELPGKKPDVDNIAKCFMDALNGLCYEDDAQVTTLFAEKRYSSDPHVEVTITTRRQDEKP